MECFLTAKSGILLLMIELMEGGGGGAKGAEYLSGLVVSSNDADSTELTQVPGRWLVIGGSLAKVGDWS